MQKKSTSLGATEKANLATLFAGAKTQNGKSLAEQTAKNAEYAFAGFTFEEGDEVTVSPQFAQPMDYTIGRGEDKKTYSTTGIVVTVKHGNASPEEVPTALGQFTRGYYTAQNEQMREGDVIDFADLQPRWGGRVKVSYEPVEVDGKTVQLPKVDREFRFKVTTATRVCVPTLRESNGKWELVVGEKSLRDSIRVGEEVR